MGSRLVLRVRLGGGDVVLPRWLAEQLGVVDGGLVEVHVEGGRLVLDPLEPRRVRVDPGLVEEALREARRVDEERLERLAETGGRH